MVVLSFLFSFSTLHKGFVRKPIDSEILVTKQVINSIMDLSQTHINSSVHSPGQSLDKIRTSLNPEQKIRLKETIEEENNTRGVDGFKPRDVQTLLKSAIALSFKGYVIVVVDEDEMPEKNENGDRIIYLTPPNFEIALAKAEEFLEKLELIFKEDHGKEPMDCLSMVLFKFEHYKTIKENLDILDGNDLEEEIVDEAPKEEKKEVSSEDSK